MSQKTLCLLFLLLATSCSSDNLPKYYKLESLRILALTLDVPEVQISTTGGGNQTLQVTPYISDINGQGSVNLTLETCLDRGVSLGANPTCDGASDKTSTSQTVNLSSPERTEAVGPFTVSISIPTGLLAAYSAPYQFNGVAYLILLKATRGNEVVTSFRRFLVSTKTPNQNPTLSDFLVSGNSLTTLPSSKVPVSFSSTSTPENYQFMSSEGALIDKTEKFETTWFVSDGELDVPRTFTNEAVTWTPATTGPVGRQTVLIGVLRDGRGGVSVLLRKF